MRKTLAKQGGIRREHGLGSGVMSVHWLSRHTGMRVMPRDWIVIDEGLIMPAYRFFNEMWKRYPAAKETV